MSNRKDEVERLMRLRQRQLSARDPHAKQREIDRRVAARRRKLRQQNSFLSIFTEVPFKWQGIVLGALIGLVILILLPLLVDAAWVDLAGLAAIIVLAIMGFFFGQALDVREELKELMRD